MTDVEHTRHAPLPDSSAWVRHPHPPGLDATLGKGDGLAVLAAWELQLELINTNKEHFVCIVVLTLNMKLSYFTSKNGYIQE